jgi:dTDP-4-amino-4,6-dideoxygalactose transaminase
MDKIEFMYSTKQAGLVKTAILARISAVIDDGLFIMGPELMELEEKLSILTDTKHAIGCANGTDALTLALLTLEIKPGDVVLVPSFTFVATAECVCMVGATPYFVDVTNNFNICPKSLAQSINDAKSQGLNIKAVISVDLFGQTCDYEAISAICKEHGLFHISDAAQSFGAKYKGKSIGGLADITTTSFFPTKPFGCYGDGGMIFTNSDEYSEKIRSLHMHGKGIDKYDNIRIGLNSRLDTIQAAVLLEKLNIFAEEVRKRNALAQYYADNLRNMITTPIIEAGNESVWAVYSITHPNRDRIMKELEIFNIPTNIYYRKPLHLQTAYTSFPRAKDLQNSERIAQEVFCLPMHPYITEEQKETIVASLKTIMENL